MWPRGRSYQGSPEIVRVANLAPAVPEWGDAQNADVTGYRWAFMKIIRRLEP